MKVRTIDPLQQEAGRAGSLFALLFIAALLLALGGCNTISGMGEDVEAGGEAMSDTAEDVEEEM
jgi:entericidin B